VEVVEELVDSSSFYDMIQNNEKSRIEDEGAQNTLDDKSYEKA
jgi:hypothetical protein